MNVLVDKEARDKVRKYCSELHRYSFEKELEDSVEIKPEYKDRVDYMAVAHLIRDLVKAKEDKREIVIGFKAEKFRAYCSEVSFKTEDNQFSIQLRVINGNETVSIEREIETLEWSSDFKKYMFNIGRDNDLVITIIS